MGGLGGTGAGAAVDVADADELLDAEGARLAVELTGGSDGGAVLALSIGMYKARDKRT